VTYRKIGDLVKMIMTHLGKIGVLVDLSKSIIAQRIHSRVMIMLISLVIILKTN